MTILHITIPPNLPLPLRNNNSLTSVPLQSLELKTDVKHHSHLPFEGVPGWAQNMFSSFLVLLVNFHIFKSSFTQFFFITFMIDENTRSKLFFVIVQQIQAILRLKSKCRKDIERHISKGNTLFIVMNLNSLNSWLSL